MIRKRIRPIRGGTGPMIFRRARGVVTPPPGGYSPGTDPSVVHWFHPESGRWSDSGRTTAATPGGSVYVWDDAGPYGTHAVASDGGNLPTLGSAASEVVSSLRSVVLGTPSDQSAGFTAQAMNISRALAFPGPVAVTAVVSFTAGGYGGNVRTFSFRGSGGTDYDTGELNLISFRATTLGQASPNVATFRGGAYQVARTFPEDSLAVVDLQIDGSTVDLRINASVDSASDPDATFSAVEWSIGKAGGSTTARFFEVIVTKGRTPTQATDCHDYLKAKYGISY